MTLISDRTAYEAYKALSDAQATTIERLERELIALEHENKILIEELDILSWKSKQDAR